MAVDNGQGKGKFVTSNSYVKIKGKKVKQWITVNGKHIPIFEGESKSDAIVRAMDKDMERNPEMKKANDAVVEHSNKVAEKERNKREYELKKKDKEITDRAAREKLRNQISKDLDEKEKQIKQNEREAKANKGNMKTEIEALKTDKQVLNYLKKHNIPIVKDNSYEHNGKLSIWIDDKTRIYKSARGYVVQGWREVDMTPSNIPVFDPSWQASKLLKK